MSAPDLDPRPAPGDDAPVVDSAGALRPEVAGTATGASTWLLLGAPVLLGLFAFLWLGSHRPGPPREVGRMQPEAASAAAAPASTAATPPPEVDAAEQAARGIAAAPPPPAFTPPAPPVAAQLVAPPVRPPVQPAPPVIASAAPPSAEAQRRRAPALVVDFGGDGASAAKPNGTAASAAPGPALNGEEQFAARVENSLPERSRAVMLRERSTVIPQGAMIPAVLETALNSDLPGFTRAVVSRDVRSFDGSTVLIPRGSRVIGQYRSASALGASRAFVIWTRVLRPDGASIQIGSNGADELGRAGLAGKVDRHFFERFSGSVLLSVISLGQAALTNGNSTQVVIGSSSDASSIAGAASALSPQNIAPTIKVAQGTPIRIFVARDLDFTAVEDEAK